MGGIYSNYVSIGIWASKRLNNLTVSAGRKKARLPLLGEPSSKSRNCCHKRLSIVKVRPS